MSGPKLQIAISVLPDGRVVFGDLPPELAEVAAILRGEAEPPPTAGGPEAQPSALARSEAHPSALAGPADSPDGHPVV